MMKKLFLCALIASSSVQGRPTAQFYARVDRSDSGGLFMKIAGVCAALFAGKYIYDFFVDRSDRNFVHDIDRHLAHYQRAVDNAVKNWPDEFAQQQRDALHAIEQLFSVSAAYQMHGAIRSLPSLDRYVLNTYDRERYELGQLMHKWRDKSEYAPLYMLAQSLDYELACLQSRANTISGIVGLHNDFVRRYRALRNVFIEHGVQWYAWRQGKLMVNEASARRAYPFIAYKKALQETYCMLTEQIIVPAYETNGYIYSKVDYMYHLTKCMHECARDLETWIYDIEVSRLYVKERAEQEIARIVDEAERRLEQHIMQLRPAVSQHFHYHQNNVHETVVVSSEDERIRVKPADQDSAAQIVFEANIACSPFE